MDNKPKLVVNSFYITYVFLMTTATITFIEAMRTNDLKIRNILNLETLSLCGCVLLFQICRYN